MLRRLVLYASIAAAAVFVVLGLVAILFPAPQGSGAALVGATNLPPSTTLPPTTVPPTTVPPTTVPSTTVPSTTAPSTTVPSTTVPSTTVPPTTVPPTTVLPTTVPPTTVPPTTVPAVTVPPTTTVTSTTVTSTTVTSTTVTSPTGGPGTTPPTTTPPGTTPPTTTPVSTLPPTPTSTLPPPSATTTTPEPVQPELPTTSGSPGKAINAIEDMKEQINNNLTPGALAFNNPARMGLGETTTIQLVVESSVSGVEVAPSVTEPGIVITADIEVAATMQAILLGRGFEIAALTPEIQPLRGDAEWRWQITATDSGRLELALTVNALIDVTEDGVPLNNAVVPIKVFEETIDVEVGVFPRVSGFFRSNFFWLGPFLLVPLAGIGWDRVRRRLK